MDRKQFCKERNLVYKGDIVEKMDEVERNAGYIKFNIPDEEEPNSLNGEGVWGWVDRESRKKYNDNSYHGKLKVILCNDPLNYAGSLIASVEVIVQCNGEYRPTLDPAWVESFITGTWWYNSEKEAV